MELLLVCVQAVHFVDIDAAALLAIVASLREQAGRVRVPIQEHANLGSILQNWSEIENGNGMRWGFHDKKISKDIA